MDGLACRTETGNGTRDDATFSQKCRERIEAVLARLPESYARVLRLHYLEGCTYLEIGGKIDVPPSAVKMRLFRARREFRRLFNNNPRRFFGA